MLNYWHHHSPRRPADSAVTFFCGLSQLRLPTFWATICAAILDATVYSIFNVIILQIVSLCCEHCQCND